jgi:CheY-like chemotaxis protein
MRNVPERSDPGGCKRDDPESSEVDRGEHWSHDPRGHDPRGRDPRSHDPRSHDPRSHDPRSHDPSSHVRESLGLGAELTSGDHRGAGRVNETFPVEAFSGEPLEEVLDELIARAAHMVAREADAARDVEAARLVGVAEGRDTTSVSRPPCVVIVDADATLRSTLSACLGAACQTHEVDPGSAVALLRGLAVVDVALVDCDQPPSAQAPIFGELARWPSAICVLMSANVQKLEQLRALGVFAPLVLDKPLRREALEAIRSATLELCLGSP